MSEGTDLLVLGGAGTAMTEGGSAAAAARAEAETKVMIVMAHQNPRNEQAAYNHLAVACTRPSFAAAARYFYPRGDNIIDGLSIGFAKEAARVWGNIQYGVEVVARLSKEEAPPHGRVDIVGWAWDMQTNVRTSAPATFPALIYRKRGGWQEPDERDFRELVARHGAIARRNAILDLIPPDIKEDLLARLRSTATSKADEDLKQDRAGTTAKLVTAFGKYGVTEDMLCHLLEVDTLERMDGTGLAQLRATYASIRDGAQQASQVFPGLGGAAAAAGQQSATVVEAEAELDDVEEEEDYATIEGDEEEEQPAEEAEATETEAEPPAKRRAASKKKAAPKKRGGQKQAEEAAGGDGPEIRVADGAWVGDLPKVSDLPYVLANVEESVVVDIYDKEERPSAMPHLIKRLEELGYDMS